MVEVAVDNVKYSYGILFRIEVVLHIDKIILLLSAQEYILLNAEVLVPVLHTNLPRRRIGLLSFLVLVPTFLSSPSPPTDSVSSSKNHGQDRSPAQNHG